MYICTYFYFVYFLGCLFHSTDLSHLASLLHYLLFLKTSICSVQGPLYIRHSSPLAYTVNKCTPAFWLRSAGLPWRRVSSLLNSGCLSLMLPPESTEKLQAPGGTSQALLCGCERVQAQSSVPWCGTALFPGTAQNFVQRLSAKSSPWERII